MFLLNGEMITNFQYVKLRIVTIKIPSTIYTYSLPSAHHCTKEMGDIVPAL